MRAERGNAGNVRLQFGRRPFNHGRPYRDRTTGHTLAYSPEQRWVCHHCEFDVPEDRYMTWRALLEDHRSSNGR